MVLRVRCEEAEGARSRCPEGENLPPIICVFLDFVVGKVEDFHESFRLFFGGGGFGLLDLVPFLLFFLKL